MFCSACGAETTEGAAFCGTCGRPIDRDSVGSLPAESTAGSTGAAVAGVAAGGATVYAGFWLRLVAVLIDGLALGIPMGFLFFLIIASALPSVMTRPSDPMRIMFAILPRLILFQLVALAGRWLYWGLMESSAWQATLGKKLLGLYVTDMEGRRVSFGRASGRFFAKIISGMILWVGFIMAGFTEKKQALHDLIANCLVLRRV